MLNEKIQKIQEINLKVNESKEVAIVPTPFNTTFEVYVDDTYDDYVKATLSEDSRSVTLKGLTATTGVSDVPAYVEIEIGFTDTEISQKVKVVVSA